jgi:UDP-glucuronate 4-epimerase
MKILITGSSGFIGFSVAKTFLEKGITVIGIDNFDPYYSVKLKKLRNDQLKKYKNYTFINADITNKVTLKKKISNIKIDYLFHFAAQPGVRYSLVNPEKYLNTNVKGFVNIIDQVNKVRLKKVIYASSSSVYGDQNFFPTHEFANLNAKNPYGITKVINEELALIYSKIFNIPFVGLRFFTVYGEWGRPDMFIIKLLNSITKNKIFYLNKSGNHYRDFTYINDVNQICEKLIKIKIFAHEVFNICSSDFLNIKKLSQDIKKIFPKAKISNIGANKADVYKTFGSNNKIRKFLKIKKFTKISIGLKNTINWYFENKIYKVL